VTKTRKLRKEDGHQMRKGGRDTADLQLLGAFGVKLDMNGLKR
jgi:hypothetical protein